MTTKRTKAASAASPSLFSPLYDLIITRNLCLFLVDRLVPSNSKLRAPSVYEVLNCVERFTLSSANLYTPSKHEKSRVYHSKVLELPPFEKLLSELLSLRTLMMVERSVLSKEIKALIEENLTYPDTPIEESSIYVDGPYLKLGDLSVFCSRRVNLLLEKGYLPAMRVITRYASVVAGGQQWGVPFDHFAYLHDTFGVRNEAFASPLNSRAIEHKDGRFCSLFKETDEVYGSLGSVFDCHFSEHKGAWTANPPFVEDIMERFSRHLLEEMDRAKELTIFVILPGWSDAKGYTLLRDSKYLVRDLRLEAGSFFFEAPNRDSIIVRTAHFYLALHKGPASKEELEKIGKALDHIKTLSPTKAERKGYFTPHLIVDVGAVSF